MPISISVGVETQVIGAISWPNAAALAQYVPFNRSWQRPASRREARLREPGNPYKRQRAAALILSTPLIISLTRSFCW
jgi:hypothetical protein